MGIPGPRVSFLIGGAQKAGTTALASFLREHPRISLPRSKEAHIFDSPDFPDDPDPALVDKLYTEHFEVLDADSVFGDATPIYMLHPSFVCRIWRYNPAMRWVIVLRDPVERAISHYFMEKSRGNEKAPLLLALLLERWRLHGHLNDFSWDSPLRTRSYLLRGGYSKQLDAIYSKFPADQVLLLRSADLRSSPEVVFDTVLRFIGVSAPDSFPEFKPVFEGSYRRLGRGALASRLARWLLDSELRDQEARYQLRRR